jgi:pilus assembly protein Flp/PilA
MREFVRHLITRDDRGQGLAEYALILALIAVVVIAAVTLLGTNINGILSTIAVAI